MEAPSLYAYYFSAIFPYILQEFKIIYWTFTFACRGCIIDEIPAQAKSPMMELNKNGDSMFLFFRAPPVVKVSAL